MPWSGAWKFDQHFRQLFLRVCNRFCVIVFVQISRNTRSQRLPQSSWRFDMCVRIVSSVSLWCVSLLEIVWSRYGRGTETKTLAGRGLSSSDDFVVAMRVSCKKCRGPKVCMYVMKRFVILYVCGAAGCADRRSTLTSWPERIRAQVVAEGAVTDAVLSNLSNMTCACVVDAACSHGMSAHGSVSLHAACVLASLAAVMLLCRSHLALLDRRS